MFETKLDALTEALVLAVTAPTRRDSYRAITLAESLAQNMSDKEVEQAKADAERRLEQTQ